MANRLSGESSPYLHQHAENPVDWYPWGDEAFALAQQRDVPILLSIGYSACHWCHVMERESFEDPATAAVMNDGFVNIKVDREERPDIDSVYMRAVQAMSGQGGWPLTVFLTPEGAPFYGGTYFPPEARHGLPSFRQILKAIQNAYSERRDEVSKNANELREILRRSTAEAGEGPVTQEGETLIGSALLDHAYRFLASRFDPTHGGFGGAPKFPQPVNLEFALRIHSRTGDEQALTLVTHTLRKMARGGMHDHLAGGFHRYSVDERWLVPHFEKMLYDNALLARVYLNAFQATGGSDLREVAESILNHLLRDMRDDGGGFYSALDADSEGEEGVFYVWTPAQIREVLDEGAASLFERCYDVSDSGNFEGKSILHLPHDLEAVARSEGMEPQSLREQLREARELLLKARALREHPFRDEKILASWNGMTLRALAEAGGVLGRESYVEAAVSGMDFVLTHMRRDERLLRSYKDGEARIDAFLEDYGAVGNALVTVYEVTLDPKWLDEIRWIADRMLELFWTEETGFFYDAPTDREELIVRPRDIMDNATPSGTSLGVELLLRTAHLLGDERHQAVAERALAREVGSLARYPSAFGRLLSSLDRTVASPVEVAIIGERNDPATSALLGAALTPFLPNLTIAGAAPSEEAQDHALPLLAGRGAQDGVSTAYVCRAYSCRTPVTTPKALTEQLLGVAGHPESGDALL